MKIFLVAVANLVISSVNAEALDVSLVCRYETITTGTQEGPLTGEFSIRLGTIQDGSVVGRSTKCAGLRGTADDVQVDVVCSYTLQNLSYDRRLILDRISGRFTEFLNIGGASTGLVFGGRCALTKPLF